MLENEIAKDPKKKKKVDLTTLGQNNKSTGVHIYFPVRGLSESEIIVSSRQTLIC